MKKLLFILLLIARLAYPTNYYIATNGDDDTGDGSFGTPWATLQKAILVADDDDTVFCRGGTYSVADNVYYYPSGGYGNNGSDGHPVVYINYPSEIPIFDFSTWEPDSSPGTFQPAIYLDHTHDIVFKGLTVKNVYQVYWHNVVFGFGAWYSQRLEYINCTAHHIMGRGFFMYESTVDITNCDAYNICDSLRTTQPGGGGTGIHVGGIDGSTAGVYNVTGCRAWYCSDQGFSGTGYSVVYDSCWAWASNHEDMDVPGLGSGFKNGLYSTQSHTVTIRNSIAAYCAHHAGFNTNNNTSPPTNYYYYNNIAYKCDVGFLVYTCLSNGYEEKEVILKNNITYNPDNGNYNALIGDNVNDHNSWNLDVTVNDSDFVSIDTSLLRSQRKADSSLPDINFLKLKSTSDLIDVGTDTITASIIIDSADFNEEEPDLGWYEYYQTPTPPAYVPQLSTNYPSRIRYNSCFTGGNIINNGGASITAKGICYSTLPNPTTSDSTIACGSGDSDYTTVVPDLTANTAYYFRAYATNSEGTGYGASEQVTTSAFSYGKSPSGKLYRINGKYVIFR